MPFIDRDGARLYWRIDGKPELPPLLLGNSLGTDQSLWDCVMPLLMRSFSVVRMDMRGHGASTLTRDAGTVDWCIALLAQDMLEVADAAGLDHFHYAGISIGGMIGLWLAAHHGERMRGMLLSNTSARLPDGVWPPRIAAVRAAGMAALAGSTIGRWFTPGYSARADAVHATILRNFLATDPSAYAGCGEALIAMDLRPCLAKVRLPTTVLTGTEDVSTPPAMGQAIAAAIAGARCIELPVAHIPHPESPARFVAEVEALLLR